jgi:hypothetical protein
MPTLAKIMELTKNGQELVNLVKIFGFQEVRAYRSFAKDALCLVVDFNLEKNNESPASINNLLLRIKIARVFNCQVMILQNTLLSPEEKLDIAKDSIVLPIKELSELVKIFGDPAQVAINDASEDRRYKNDLETYEIVYSKNLSEFENVHLTVSPKI